MTKKRLYDYYKLINKYEKSFINDNKYELIEWFKKAGANRIMMTHYTWNPEISKYYAKKGFVPFETNYVYKVKGENYGS